MIQIIPYLEVDGIRTLKDSDIYELFVLMKSEGKLEQVFYDGSVKTPDDFLLMFKRLDNWLYVFMNQDDRPVGFFWINNFEGSSCRVHFCFFNNVGKNLLRVAISGLEHIAKYFRLIRGVTPLYNRTACKLVQKSGMRVLGVEPDRIYNYYTGKTEPALITYYHQRVDEEESYGRR